MVHFAWKVCGSVENQGSNLGLIGRGGQIRNPWPGRDLRLIKSSYCLAEIRIVPASPENLDYLPGDDSFAKKTSPVSRRRFPFAKSRLLSFPANSHSVERSVREEYRHQEEHDRQYDCQHRVVSAERYCKLHSQQSKEGRELNYRVHGH
jgi:hypothetical protein